MCCPARPRRVFTQSAAGIKQADLNTDTAVRSTLGKYQQSPILQAALCKLAQLDIL